MKTLIWVIYSRCRLESVIAKYSIHPQVLWLTFTHTPQNIRFICAGAMPTHNPRKLDSSAKSCNSRFSNRDSNKEAKLLVCSFKYLLYTYLEINTKRLSVVVRFSVVMWYCNSGLPGCPGQDGCPGNLGKTGPLGAPGPKGFRGLNGYPGSQG